MTNPFVLGAIGLGLALVFSVAFVLGSRMPDREANPSPTGVAETVQVGDLRVTLQLDEPALGPRVIDVLVLDAAGQPVAMNAVRLRFSMAEMDMGTIEADAEPVDTGRFRAQGPFFSMAGRWIVETTLLRDGQLPIQVPFALAIAAPGEASGPLNPLAPDEPTLAAGRQLYAANCAVCHGANGKGDGPAAVGLRPPPGDFTQHMIPGKHTDGQAFLWIKNGYPGTAMPAWGQRLSETEIWQLVTYLRTFGQAAVAAATAATTSSPVTPATAVPNVQEPLPPLIFTRAGNVWRSDGSGRSPQQLSTLPAGSYAQYPVISPAGDRIALVITSQGPLGEDEWPQLNPETKLAVMGADGSDMQVFWDPERGLLGQPVWTPDGQAVYVAFADVLSPPTAPVPDRLFQIIRVDPVTKARAVALEDAYDLMFSRDGQMMTFLRWNKDLFDFTLSVAAPDGSGEREVVRSGAFSDFSSPRFSPDGRQILFVSTGGPPTDDQGNPIKGQSPLDRALGLFAPPVAEAHGSSADLWIVNADGTGLRRLTKLREDSPMGVFAPDGARIVVMGAGGIYLMNADGSDLRKIDPIGDHGGLDWVGQ